MLPPFRVRNPRASTSLTGPDYADDFIISSTHNSEDPIVEIEADQYDDLVREHPDAALTYLDDDDGEVVTVGSSFELGQRLEEPVPRSVQVPEGRPALHTFDVQDGLALWRHYVSLPQNSTSFKSASKDMASSELEKVWYDPIKDSYERHFTATKPPVVEGWRQVNALSHSEPEDELTRETTPLLQGYRDDATASDNLTSEGRRQAKEAGARLRSNLGHVLAETTISSHDPAHGNRWAAYGHTPKRFVDTTDATESNYVSSQDQRQVEEADSRLRSNLRRLLKETAVSFLHDVPPGPSKISGSTITDKTSAYAYEEKLPDGQHRLETSTTSSNPLTNSSRPLLEVFEAELAKLSSTAPAAAAQSQSRELPHQDIEPVEPSLEPSEERSQSASELFNVAAQSFLRGLNVVAADISRNAFNEAHGHFEQAQLRVPQVMEQTFHGVLGGITNHMQNLAVSAQNASNITREAANRTREADLRMLQGAAHGLQGLAAVLGDVTKDIFTNHGPSPTDPMSKADPPLSMAPTEAPSAPPAAVAPIGVPTTRVPQPPPTPLPERASAAVHSSFHGRPNEPKVDDGSGPLPSDAASSADTSVKRSSHGTRADSPSGLPPVSYEYVVPHASLRLRDRRRPVNAFESLPSTTAAPLTRSRSPPARPRRSSLFPRHGPIHLPENLRSPTERFSPFVPDCGERLRYRRSWHPEFTRRDSDAPAVSGGLAQLRHGRNHPLSPPLNEHFRHSPFSLGWNESRAFRAAGSPPMRHAKPEELLFQTVQEGEAQSVASASRTAPESDESRFPSLSQFESQMLRDMPTFPALPSMAPLVPQNLQRPGPNLNPFSASHTAVSDRHAISSLNPHDSPHTEEGRATNDRKVRFGGTEEIRSGPAEGANKSRRMGWESFLESYEQTPGRFPSDNDTTRRGRKHDVEIVSARASPSSSPNADNRKIKECVEQLRDMGFADHDGDRLLMYAQAAEGNLGSAIDMIDEEQSAYLEAGHPLVQF